MRVTWIVSLLAGASIAALVLCGCSSEPAADKPTESAETTESESPTLTSDFSEIDIPDDPGSVGDTEPWEGVVTGFEGTPSVLGGWVVTVTESVYGRATDDVSVPSGMTRLEIVVELENQVAGPASVIPQDWSLTDGAGGRYTVLPAQQPEKQGEATVESGETEDVTLSFAVPGESERHALRFQPLGSDEALEVTLR